MKRLKNTNKKIGIRSSYCAYPPQQQQQIIAPPHLISQLAPSTTPTGTIMYILYIYIKC